jgi:hypothetical protein
LTTPAKPRYLTKSRFKLAIECPTKLFYTGKPEYANTNSDDEFLAMLADGGFQVGELAKLMYPDGVDIKTKDVGAAIAETSELLKQDTVTVFEPAIVYEGFLVRVDVLIKRGNVFEVIEVKAKSYSGDVSEMVGARGGIKSTYLPYLQDVAFQKHVVQNAFPGSTVTAHLLMPDKSKRATVNGLNQYFKVKRNGRQADVMVDERAKQPGLAVSVLTCVSVDHLVNEILSNDLVFPGGSGSFAEVATGWAKAYAADDPIAPTLTSHCHQCEFKAPSAGPLRSGFHECWKQVLGWTDEDFEEGTVLDLWNFRGKDKLLEQGVYRIRQVHAEDLKVCEHAEGEITNPQRQWMQVGGLPPESRPRGYYLDDAGLAHAMRSWTYPLHFIDFETAAVALPFHEGRRPYEQVGFQFSHHVMHANGEVRHANQYLCDEPGVFPNYAFVRALREALRHDQGTIMRWSYHENTILEAIKRQLDEDAEAPDDKDELIAFIDDITKGGGRAMVDLADLARKHYFHPSTKGSSSIKKILPAVMSSSAFLKKTYSQAIYGTPEGISSHNFDGVAWWQQDTGGKVIDPYQLLVSQIGALDDLALQAEAISQGGAASYAYLKLQFEDLDNGERESLRAGLLRYCELDTLAMVFIVQAWTKG